MGFLQIKLTPCTCRIFYWNAPKEILSQKTNSLSFDRASPQDLLKILVNLKVMGDLIPQAILFVSIIYKARY